MLKPPAKRLLFILNSLGFGGAERQTIDLVNTLNTDLFEISLIYLHPRDELLPKLDIQRLKVLKFFKRRGKFDLGMIKRLGHFIQEGHFDLVICINEYPLFNVYCSKIFFQLNFLLITVLHSTILPSGFWDSFKNLLYKILLNKCDKLIFVSKNQAEFWAKNYNINKQKSIYINNGIDETSFVDTFTEAAKSDIRNNLGFKQEDIIFGICGRLSPEKKHEDFIEAVYFARKRIPHLKGLIIGDGPQKDFLKKMINDYTLENVVKLTGYQADVRPYISICDCMTLVSISEGFSIAALEAMAMKKPMIMTNIGGASEIITNEATGFLYEVGDIKKLSDLMIRMSNRSICQKMGEEAARQVKTNFTLCNMSKKYESFFLNIEPEK